MKTPLLAVLAVAVVSNGFAQGQIDVGNGFGGTVFRAPIFGPEPGNPGLAIVGQPATGAYPTGTTVYTGPRLQGTNYTFGFYASTTGITTDASALTLIGMLQFGNTAGTAGNVTTTAMNVPNVPAGSPTTWQIRVWDNQGGTVGFNESPYRGQTPLINSGPLGGISPAGGVFLTPSTSSGWTSFNIYAHVIPPTLTILPAEGFQLHLRWPTNATGYALESTTSLATLTWAAVTNPPSVIGNQFELTVGTAVGLKFYRLNKP